MEQKPSSSWAVKTLHSKKPLARLQLPTATRYSVNTNDLLGHVEARHTRIL